MTSLLPSILQHVEQGRFRYSMLILAAMGAWLSGVEVILEHYQGSYGKKIMYSPIIFSVLLSMSCLLGLVSPDIGRRCIPVAATLLAADAVIGFGFHIRGIVRKPGGLARNLVYNVVTGPPLFAPLLLGISSVMAMIAINLLPEDAKEVLSKETLYSLQLWLAITTACSSLLNGFEAFYSHYKSNFKNTAQWTPIILTPPLFIAALVDIFMPHIAEYFLLWFAILVLISGCVGTIFHLRGILRRPGFAMHKLYSFIYGPPLFAPLLFAATGILGLLAVFVGKKPP